jgi:formylglycine-generating enzyme required for sulfatase activity
VDGSRPELYNLAPCFGLLYLYFRPAVATQDGANPWRLAPEPKAAGDGFILIRGDTFFSGDAVTRRGRQEPVRVEDFEMLDHTVTNAEYKDFVDAAGFTPPPQWQNGRIPPGMVADSVR